MPETFYLVLAAYISMFVFAAVGITAFVVYKVLDKYADFGDTPPRLGDYTVGGIDYIRSHDRVPSSDKYHLFADYGTNPYEGRRHSVPEQLVKNSGDQGESLPPS